MKEIVLNSYDKTKNHLIANILQGFLMRCIIFMKVILKQQSIL